MYDPLVLRPATFRVTTMKLQHIVFLGRIPALELIVKGLRNFTPSEVEVVGGVAQTSLWMSG